VKFRYEFANCLPVIQWDDPRGGDKTNGGDLKNAMMMMMMMMMLMMLMVVVLFSQKSNDNSY